MKNEENGFKQLFKHSLMKNFRMFDVFYGASELEVCVWKRKEIFNCKVLDCGSELEGKCIPAITDR